MAAARRARSLAACGTSLAVPKVVRMRQMLVHHASKINPRTGRHKTPVGNRPGIRRCFLSVPRTGARGIWSVKGDGLSPVAIDEREQVRICKLSRSVESLRVCIGPRFP